VYDPLFKLALEQQLGLGLLCPALPLAGLDAVSLWSSIIGEDETGGDGLKK